MPNPVVVDISFFAGFFIPDEDDTHVTELISRVGSLSLHAPRLFVIELGNVLTTSLRRNRMTEGQFASALREAAIVPLQLHDNASFARMARQASLASRCGISFYDALYLDLALENTAQLATLDARLQDAARAEGVVLYS